MRRHCYVSIASQREPASFRMNRAEARFEVQIYRSVSGEKSTPTDTFKALKVELGIGSDSKSMSADGKAVPRGQE